MPSRSDRDALELETPILSSDDRPEVGVDPARVEELVAPFDDWILLRMDPPQQSSRGGILIGDKSVPESRIGVVVSQGEGFLLPDGSGRAIMYAQPGDRVLIERRAGKTLPRVPDSTDPRTGQRGYLLIRNGSLVARLSPRAKPGPRMPGDKVDGAPQLEPKHVEPCSDWTLVRTDRPVQSADPRRPRRSGVAAPRVILPGTQQSAQSDRTDTWSGTVVRAGPGRLAEDGVTVAAPRTSVGERVLFMGSAMTQTVPGIDGHVLILEREVVCAGLTEDPSGA